MGRIGLIILAIVAVLGIVFAGGYNKIRTLDVQTNAVWAQVQNEYQRRADLVPNLVNTVKGAANFEKSTLTDVINARANATKVTLSPEMLSDPAAVQKFEQAQGALGQTLSRLMVVSERYPDLKANQQFMALQSQLEGTENRITVSRRDYIQAVQQYNTAVRTLPGALFAGFMGAKPKADFTATTPGAEAAPAVKFD